jgi:hypothetical protein
MQGILVTRIREANSGHGVSHLENPTASDNIHAENHPPLVCCTGEPSPSNPISREVDRIKLSFRNSFSDFGSRKASDRSFLGPVDPWLETDTRTFPPEATALDPMDQGVFSAGNPETTTTAAAPR